MRVVVNGEPREVPPGTTVEGLLSMLGIPAKAVAVERNRGVVPRADYPSMGLGEDDAIEVVTFVGGG